MGGSWEVGGAEGGGGAEKGSGQGSRDDGGQTGSEMWGGGSPTLGSLVPFWAWRGQAKGMEAQSGAGSLPRTGSQQEAEGAEGRREGGAASTGRRPSAGEVGQGGARPGRAWGWALQGSLDELGPGAKVLELLYLGNVLA